MKIGDVNDIIQDTLKCMENGTYDFTKDDKCSGCGQCCSNILPMTQTEIDTIRRYIKRANVREQKHFVPSANPMVDLTCPFLDTSKSAEKCTIYPVRPRVCRDFICNPKQRKEPKVTGDLKCVFVREEFFGC